MRYQTRRCPLFYPVNRMDDDGFTLLEVVLVLLIVSTFAFSSLFGLLRTSSVANLSWSRDKLLWDLRLQQARAYQQDASTMVTFNRVLPLYNLYNGATFQQTTYFRPGISYTDGYLRLPAEKISYGNQGDSHIGGTLALSDAYNDEQDIIIYLGSGLAVKGEFAHADP